MAQLLCTSSCGTIGQPPASYWELCDGDVLRKFAFPYYGLASCDLNLADPTSIEDWEAAVTAGDIVLGPRGKIEFTVTPETSSDVNVCGGDTVISTTYNMTFSTYQATPIEDARYYYNLLTGHGQYRIFWFDCDGNIWLPKEYADFVYETNNAGTPVAPVGTPGFAFTISSPPVPTEGDGQKLVWTFDFQIELSGQELIIYTQIPGLQAALGG